MVSEHSRVGHNNLSPRLTDVRSTVTNLDVVITPEHSCDNVVMTHEYWQNRSKIMSYSCDKLVITWPSILKCVLHMRHELCSDYHCDVFKHKNPELSLSFTLSHFYFESAERKSLPARPRVVLWGGAFGVPWSARSSAGCHRRGWRHAEDFLQCQASSSSSGSWLPRAAMRSVILRAAFTSEGFLHHELQVGSVPFLISTSPWILVILVILRCLLSPVCSLCKKLTVT